MSAAIILPLQPMSSPKNIALRINGDLREEIGWPELAATVAGVRDTVPPEKRADMGIIVGNYGEAGAINLQARPRTAAGAQWHDTAWYRGYGSTPPQTYRRRLLAEEAEAAFQSCRLAAMNVIPFDIRNEEGEYHREIFLCGAPKQPWPAFWADFRRFG